jgi:hypothetical protein
MMMVVRVTVHEMTNRDISSGEAFRAVIRSKVFDTMCASLLLHTDRYTAPASLALTISHDFYTGSQTN